MIKFRTNGIKLVMLCLSGVLINPALAELTHKLNGAISFEAGIPHYQFKQGSNSVLLYSEGSVNLAIQNKTEDNERISYGGKIVLNTTTKSKSAASLNGSRIFIKSKIGLMEFGSQHSIAKVMQVNPKTCGAMGMWSRYVKFPQNYYFTAGSSLPIENFTTNAVGYAGTESVRKISYYTPEYHGIKLGVSYIPDTSNSTGKVGDNTTTKATIIKLPGSMNRYIEYKRVVTDAWVGGINYKHDFESGSSIKLGAVIEYGNALPMKMYNDPECKNKIDDVIRVKDVLAYSVGVSLSKDSIHCGISYSTWGESFFSNEIITKPKSNSWSIGLAYIKAPIGVSIEWAHSIYGDNCMHAITFGSDYKLAEGLSTYFDLSYFIAKGRQVLLDNNAQQIQTASYDNK
ncbi:gram-negative porin family protein [Orientia chuto str. Dubai]|uniref:Gram-negative porin family protein n=1 Tax=Orientia chuto str. Dubai TaxID=1359168 RepID=A0A0F3MHH0_9RICK|nr:porin [Candidatus Orientia mediorientalis]KJV55203.1 gram-negative porin family protein [Orientia chuto str. Dubai]